MELGKIIKMMKPYKQDILFSDRTGNIISIYLKGGAKIVLPCKSINESTRLYSKVRRELEEIYV